MRGQVVYIRIPLPLRQGAGKRSNTLYLHKRFRKPIRAGLADQFFRYFAARIVSRTGG